MFEPVKTVPSTADESGIDERDLEGYMCDSPDSKKKKAMMMSNADREGMHKMPLAPVRPSVSARLEKCCDYVTARISSCVCNVNETCTYYCCICLCCSNGEFRNVAFWCFWVCTFLFSLLILLIVTVAQSSSEGISQFMFAGDTKKYEDYVTAVNFHDVHGVVSETVPSPCNLAPIVLLYPSKESVVIAGTSGVYWLRYLLEQGSRILTTSGGQFDNMGSCDIKTAFEEKMRGECLSEAWFYHVLAVSTTSLVELSRIYFNYNPTSVVLLVRNPFDTAIEEYALNKALGRNIPGVNVLVKGDTMADATVFHNNKDEWEKFLEQSIFHWKENIATAFSKYDNVHVVWYEDIFSSNTFETELKGVYEFIYAHRQQRRAVDLRDAVNSDQFMACVHANDKLKTDSVQLAARQLPISKAEIPRDTRTKLCDSIKAEWNKLPKQKLFGVECAF